MKHLVLLLAAGALACQCACASAGQRNRRKLPNELELGNSLEDNAITNKGGLKKFVRILQRPPAVVHQINSPVQLTCEAMGSPAPSIQWLRNDLPILEHDLQSTELVDASETSIARVVSSLLVKPSSQYTQRYSCLVTAGRGNAVASTTVYNTGKSRDLSERHRLYPLRPRIVVSYKVLMDTMGSSVVLPCRVKGHPRPKVSWWDNNGEVVSGDDRMKILRTGELIISNLLWTDMGEFTCRAYNVFGADSATTFIYPVAV